jgi:hypothetical protein
MQDLGNDNRAKVRIFVNKRISVCKVMSAPAEIVWEILTDTHLWPAWGPSLITVDCDDRYIKPGSSGRVKTVLRFWLPFTVTTCRQMDFWTWNIGPVQATGHRIIRNNETSCTLCFDMQWWAFAYIAVCWLALIRIDKIASAKSNSA